MCIKISLSYHIHTQFNIHTVVDCGPLENPDNGLVITVSGTTLNQVAQYSCFEGYRLSGLERRLCQENARWSGNAPTCNCELKMILTNRAQGLK